ncbi:hypothetical protein KEM60_00282 [Austwickia sp. TVS 96-490-7B]|uniref:NAD(P)/FAD-dependent oxidoreductase n=1 Tax=Austwickia sp. TVS 96-490-7B TaxID=2830843 RepID=UPI001D395E66|nr:FAD/NAD(P)-binding oxidoreductase [Austwickia sp. TVS 96-490-7B]MBW3084099.1 hypothetical protein [Austwickia sp. TVS 96-490-7B]
MIHHTIVVIGAGTAGNTVAARLCRAGARDVAVVDPYPMHYYQPLWTLVGGGRASRAASERPRQDVLPVGVHWITDAAEGIDPERRTVLLRERGPLSYDQLVVAPGIQLNWDRIPGLQGTIGAHRTASNYRYDLAPLTWELIRTTAAGTAVFTMPPGPIKCAGAPQKIAYLAADYWRRQGVLDRIDIHLIVPTPALFGIPQFAEILADTAAAYGITVHLSTRVTAVDGPARCVHLHRDDTGEDSVLPYDMAHFVPPQSAPDWVARSPLAAPDDPGGYVDVDPRTLQHVRHREIFALGDVAATPNSKTGAAVRHQAPIVVANMKAAYQGLSLPGRYDGYASCPLTLSRRTLLLAEFDYTGQPAPSYPLPWPDTTAPILDFNLFKKVALPVMYWNFMLKGLF